VTIPAKKKKNGKKNLMNIGNTIDY